MEGANSEKGNGTWYVELVEVTLNLDIVYGLRVVFIKHVVLYCLVLGAEGAWIGSILETRGKVQVVYDIVCAGHGFWWTLL